MTSYHKTDNGVWTRCRAVKRKGAGVSLCPLEAIGVRSEHRNGMEGIAASGGGVLRRWIAEDTYRETKISPNGDGTFEAATGKRKRVFKMDGTLIGLKQRVKAAKIGSVNENLGGQGLSEKDREYFSKWLPAKSNEQLKLHALGRVGMSLRDLSEASGYPLADLKREANGMGLPHEEYAKTFTEERESVLGAASRSHSLYASTAAEELARRGEPISGQPVEKSADKKDTRPEWQKKADDHEDYYNLMRAMGENPARSFRFSTTEYGVQADIVKLYLNETDPEVVEHFSETVDYFIDYYWHDRMAQENFMWDAEEARDYLKDQWRSQVTVSNFADYSENREEYDNWPDASESADELIDLLIELHRPKFDLWYQDGSGGWKKK